MWKPSRRSGPDAWFGWALAAVALLVFAGGGASGYRHLQDQKARDEARTSLLIGCLEAAHVAVDTTAATNACLSEYADRVPALLKSNPYALVHQPTTASQGAALGAISATAPPTWRPTPSPSRAAEAANPPDPGRGEDASSERSEGRNATAVQRVRPTAGRGEPQQPRGPQPSDSTDPPRGNRGQGHGDGRPAGPGPAVDDHAAPPTAPPRTRPPGP